MTGPRVVILGGGFGGIEAAKALARTTADVTLIDRQNHHCFQPLLYQVATAALSPADVAWPIRHILSQQTNARVIMAEVRAIDSVAGVVRTDQIDVPYDYLVVATGATHSYFGHDEWSPYAPGLKRIEDATEIRRRFLKAFERAELSQDEPVRERWLTFVIIGGGPTGVEMAGAMADVARRTLAKDFRRIDSRRARIVLVEAGPRLLPAFPQSLSQYAQDALERLGVETRTDARVVNCSATGVEIEGGERIESATIVWAAGVAASPVSEWLSVPHDRAGRVEVGLDLLVPGFKNVFVIGDAALVKAGKGYAPALAPAAKQMGRYAGNLIAANVQGARGNRKPFLYRHQGDLATIGRNKAIVKIGSLQLTGFAGWLFWSVTHIFFLIGLRHRAAVAFAWLWDYLTFQRGARLITEK